MLTKEEINEKLKNQKSRLKYFRKLNNLSIDKICRDTGINKNTYLRLEREPVNKGTVGIYLTLAEYYGTSVDYIIGNDVEPTCIIKYINKRTIDELNSKKEVYEKLASIITDDGLNIHDLNESIINLLKLSEKEIQDLKKSKSVIPNIILKKKAIKTYPYNLLAQMFGTEALTTNFYVTKKLITDLNKLLDQYLTDVETYVLKLRYVNELKLEDIATLRDVSRERIHQIEAKTLRRLRHITYTQFLLLSKQISNKKNEIQSLESQIDQIRKKMNEENMNNVESQSENKSIEELVLPIRPYNALKISEISTVKDILKSIQNIEILKIRNLGLVSINQIINILQNLDYLEKDEHTSKKLSGMSQSALLKRLNKVRTEISLKYKF